MFDLKVESNYGFHVPWGDTMHRSMINLAWKNWKKFSIPHYILPLSVNDGVEHKVTRNQFWIYSFCTASLLVVYYASFICIIMLAFARWATNVSDSSKALQYRQHIIRRHPHCSYLDNHGQNVIILMVLMYYAIVSQMWSHKFVVDRRKGSIKVTS